MCWQCMASFGKLCSLSAQHFRSLAAWHLLYREGPINGIKACYQRHAPDMKRLSNPPSRVIQLASSMLCTISKAYSDMLKSLVIDFRLTPGR